jgi:membrane-associated protease RseP (regulator of RpoE activity)
MSSPRHLWSGDWELDSAAAREELAARRAQNEEPVGSPPEVSRARPSAAAPVRPAAVARRRGTGPRLRRLVARVGSRLELRAALLVTVLVLLTAGIAFGVTLLLNASAGQTASTANYAHSMLGIDVAGSPSGIVITSVVPGSPAQTAGLEPGDLIDEINSQPVGTVDGVSAALGGLRAGDTIEIQATRGLAIFTTQATLTTRSPGSP